jgi:hypothetical protein
MTMAARIQRSLLLSLALMWLICMIFSPSVGSVNSYHNEDDLQDASALNQLWKKESASAAVAAGNTSEKMQDMPMPDNDNTFCRGMYMTMFMDGFHYSLGRSKENPSRCLTYFVSSWRLSDKGKFVGAMMFSFLFALMTESLSACRGLVVRNCHGRRLRKSFLTLIYALQSTAGYLLMFAAMSYSKELLLSVVVGLMVGNRLFMRYDDFKPHHAPSPQQRQHHRQVTTVSTGPSPNNRLGTAAATNATTASRDEGLLFQPLLASEQNAARTPRESYNTV